MSRSGFCTVGRYEFWSIETRKTDDRGTHAEKKGPLFHKLGIGQGCLIRATGCMLQRKTPTSRSLGSKSVPGQLKGLTPLSPMRMTVSLEGFNDSSDS